MISSLLDSLFTSTWAQWAVPLPVIIPALAAGLSLLAGRRPRIQVALSWFTLFLLIVLNIALLWYVDTHGIQTLHIGSWGSPVGIVLVADRLACVMLTVSSVVLFCVMWYAISQGIRDAGDDEPITAFHPIYLLLTMGVNLSFLAGDLFNLYVGFEIFLAASYVLMTLGGSALRVRAGISYTVVSLASSMVFLVGLALIYASVGTVTMAEIARRMGEIPSGVRAAMCATLLIAFGIKAAVFPLDAWLPDSYPTAPSLVTAVFAGLLTKVGVYAIIRTRSILFPTGDLDSLMMCLAGATMIVGILGALAQNDIKRLLSFTLVSHIGYMVFGLALGSAQGLSGAIFYAVHHVLVQTALFLVVGLIERQAGTSSLRRLGSLAKASPVIALLYFIPAINLGGIPPLSGFIGKVMLIQAGASQGGFLAWLLIGGALATSLLTLYTMMTVWSKGFWRDRADAPEGHIAMARPAVLADVRDEIELQDREDVGRVPPGMFLATSVLVGASLAVTVLAGPLMGITDRAAESTQDTQVYQSAVLSNEGVRAQATGSAPHAVAPAEADQPIERQHNHAGGEQ